MFGTLYRQWNLRLIGLSVFLWQFGGRLFAQGAGDDSEKSGLEMISESMRGRFGERSSSRSLIDLLLLIAIVALVIFAVTWISSKMKKQENRERSDDADSLFKQLCKAHGIHSNHARLLHSIAEAADLPEDCQVFLCPQAFATALRLARFESRQNAIKTLFEQVFLGLNERPLPLPEVDIPEDAAAAFSCLLDMPNVRETLADQDNDNDGLLPDDLNDDPEPQDATENRREPTTTTKPEIQHVEKHGQTQSHYSDTEESTDGADEAITGDLEEVVVAPRDNDPAGANRPDSQVANEMMQSLLFTAPEAKPSLDLPPWNNR